MPVSPLSESQTAAFIQSMKRGGYSLLLGAGVCLDSTNAAGDPLPSGNSLRTRLCSITGAPDGTSLSRVAGLLERHQIDLELTKRFSGCKGGASVREIPHYLWRHIYTFNIDDVLQNTYASDAASKQNLEWLNFDDPFHSRPARSSLQLIHLHGSVLNSSSGYVFSVTEYAKATRASNPWMHTLSELLATEPFIIAGASLSEPDLEFYLANRNTTSPRRDRGPSILVEPYPNVVTEADCKRHGLILFKATMQEFMEWVKTTIPAPPSVAEITLPDNEHELFEPGLPARTRLRFFGDYTLVVPVERSLPANPTPYLYGRSPSWDDIQTGLDIQREAVQPFNSLLDRFLSAVKTNAQPGIVLYADAGSGKTSVLKRLAFDAAKGGVPAFWLSTLEKVDVPASLETFSSLLRPALVFIDNLADHIGQIVDIMRDPSASRMVLFVAAERGYRRQHIETVVGNSDLLRDFGIQPFTQTELLELIERYRAFGLVATRAALARPKSFAALLRQDPAAVAVCRILNDFQPLDRIVESLWAESPEAHRLPYLCVAVAEQCHNAGIRYSVVRQVANYNFDIQELFDQHAALRLTPSAAEDEYVNTANSAMAERLLRHVSRSSPDALERAFVRLAAALAPVVNRNAIIHRTTEARIVQRLFDVDTIVRPFLGSRTADFFDKVKPDWEWNSRYWEQRALLTVDTDVATAIQYARHAVAIERHPFPLTTLGKVLLAAMQADQRSKGSYFSEAFDVLCDATRLERSRARVSVHPFMTLIALCAAYLEAAGVFTLNQEHVLRNKCDEALQAFPHDRGLQSAIGRLNQAASRR